VGNLVRAGYTVIMQDSSGWIKAKHPSIENLEYVDDLGALMRRCDLVVLPYVAEQYSVRGSGILWEAVANGVPVLCPSNTALSQNLGRLNIGVTFDVLDPHVIANQVQICADSYSFISAKAREVANVWGRDNGPIKFVESLTDPRNFGVLY
jgi:glycosyltransferase involved in cell wall biosynthesis